MYKLVDDLHKLLNRPSGDPKKSMALPYIQTRQGQLIQALALRIEATFEQYYGRTT